jgi:outer membrane protein assembly factor BamB
LHWRLLIVVVLCAEILSAQDDVLVLTVTSKNETNVIEWRNPLQPPYGSTRVVGRTDRFPVDADDISDAFVVDVAGALGGKGSVEHSGLQNGTTYFYRVFVDDGSGHFSGGETIQAKPIRAGGPVKWRFAPSTAAVSMTPPGIGLAILFPNNDGNVYGIERGVDGGTWFPGSLPSSPGVVQHRPPVIALTGVMSADNFTLVSTQDGVVHAVDAETGDVVWFSLDLGSLQAGPSAWLEGFGGGADTVVVGTRNSAGNNTLFGLHAGDGTEAWRFEDSAGEGIGIVNGAPTLDYPRGRLYFASHALNGAADTVFAVDLASGIKVWSTRVGNVSGSPALRDQVLYVGADDGTIYGLDADDGSVGPSFDTGDGVTKGFVFPDLYGDRVYVSTATTVWSLRDEGPVFTLRWAHSGIPGPSIVLYPPGSQYLWVGSSDGRLYQIDVTTGNPAQPPDATFVVLGDGTAGVGSPSLDVTRGLVYVGAEDGSLYAVDVPF